MRLEVIERFEDFLKLEGQWNDVLSASHSEHVCLTFEWMRCWWEAFGKKAGLRICLVRDSNDELIGIAPFMLSRTKIFGIPVRRLGFVYNDNSSRMDMIIVRKRQEVVYLVWQYLWSQRRCWDIVFLENIPEESRNFILLKECLKTHKTHFVIKEGLCSPFISITEKWDDYFSARSWKFRKTLKNVVNRIEKTKEFTLERLGDLEGKGDLFQKICDISDKSWKARCKRDIAQSEENRRFYTLLDEQFGKKGRQNIWLLSVHNDPVAYEYTLQYKQKTYALRADFDEAYGHLSPGVVLNCQMIKYCFESGMKECDLCGNDEEYKKKWTRQYRKHYHFTVYTTAVFSRFLYFAVELCIHPLKQRLKKVAFLRTLKKSVVDRKYYASH